MHFIAAPLVAFLSPLPQVRPWRGRGHEPHRGNLWNRGLSGEPVPCEQAGLRIPLGDTTPGEVAALLVLVSASGMRRGRDAQCLCQGWQEVGAKSEDRSRAPGPSICLRDETGKRRPVPLPGMASGRGKNMQKRRQELRSPENESAGAVGKDKGSRKGCGRRSSIKKS